MTLTGPRRSRQRWPAAGQRFSGGQEGICEHKDRHAFFQRAVFFRYLDAVPNCIHARARLSRSAVRTLDLGENISGKLPLKLGTGGQTFVLSQKLSALPQGSFNSQYDYLHVVLRRLSNCRGKG
jgi:hypothetical protein